MSAPLSVFQFVLMKRVCNNHFVLFSNSPDPTLQLLYALGAVGSFQVQITATVWVRVNQNGQLHSANEAILEGFFLILMTEVHNPAIIHYNPTDYFHG